jgi:hypothetical protein
MKLKGNTRGLHACKSESNDEIHEHSKRKKRRETIKMEKLEVSFHCFHDAMGYSTNSKIFEAASSSTFEQSGVNLI